MWPASGLDQSIPEPRSAAGEAEGNTERTRACGVQAFFPRSCERVFVSTSGICSGVGDCAPRGADDDLGAPNDYPDLLDTGELSATRHGQALVRVPAGRPGTEQSLTPAVSHRLRGCYGRNGQANTSGPTSPPTQHAQYVSVFTPLCSRSDYSGPFGLGVFDPRPRPLPRLNALSTREYIYNKEA
jgi:hypothetical protein